MSTMPADGLPEPPAFRSQGRQHELARALRRKRRLRAGVAQLLAVAAAVVLAFVMPHIHFGADITTTRAIEMLVAVGAGTVTFLGIVFSLLFLVVQFGSTTFSPRLNLFRDAPIVWRTFAFYTAVVVYSFTAALVIGGDERTSTAVPIVAFVAVLASIVLYRQLQTAAFKSIQLAPTLHQIVRRGREVIDGLYILEAGPADPIHDRDRETTADTPEPSVREILWTRPTTVVQIIDVPRVLRAAERTRAVVHFRVGSGQRIAEGAPLAAVSGHAEAKLERAILKALTVGEERSFEQDPALALRLLADIGLRALSPAVNDPSTAVQALDAMDGLLRVLATRDLRVEHIAAEDGAIRVKLVLPTWDDYLVAALDEIIALRAPSPGVAHRILRLLDDLTAIAPASRRSALDVRRRRVHGRDDREYPDDTT